MQKNVGTLDKIVRISAGVLLITLAVLDLIGPWGWLGVIVLATGLVGICMPYKLFGFSTCAIKTDNNSVTE